jgi:sec-independent protein translocase protein TatA
VNYIAECQNLSQFWNRAACAAFTLESGSEWGKGLNIVPDETLNMAFDDPIVWVLIVAVVVFLFGANKIPSLARSLGQARREFDGAMKGNVPSEPIGTMSNASVVPPPMPVAPAAVEASDPLIEAAQKEGIDTSGKTKQQIASELSWKLNNH